MLTLTKLFFFSVNIPSNNTSAPPVASNPHRSIYDPVTYDYQGYSHPAAALPSKAPQQRPPAHEDFSQDWDEAANALSNLFN